MKPEKDIVWIAERILTPIYLHMKEEFLPSLPEDPKKILGMMTDVLKDYWNRSKDILSYRERLISCKEISEKTGQDESVEEILNFLSEKKIIYQVRTGMELNASPEVVLTPLGLCFLGSYKGGRLTISFKDTCYIAEKMLGETYNISALERLSDVIEESKKNPTEKERVLASILILSQAISKNRALKLEKISVPSAENIYKHQEALLRATELLSKTILGASSNVFKTISDFDNTVRNPKRLIYKTDCLLVRESLKGGKGYRFYFQIADEAENLHRLMMRILGKLNKNHRKKIIEFLEKYMRDEGLLFPRMIREELLGDPHIELRYLQDLRSIVKGL